MIHLAWKLLLAASMLPATWYPPKKNPETPDERLERLATIMIAISIESKTTAPGWGWSNDDAAWAAFTKMYFESGRFALSVHNGKRRGDGGRSVCLGQIMNGGDDLVGTDIESTRRCVRRVMDILGTHHNRCVYGSKPNVSAMSSVYAGYGTGHSCDPKLKFAARRAWLWWKLRKFPEPTGIIPKILIDMCPCSLKAEYCSDKTSMVDSILTEDTTDRRSYNGKADQTDYRRT
jgi:hypothetical protein